MIRSLFSAIVVFVTLISQPTLATNIGKAHNPPQELTIASLEGSDMLINPDSQRIIDSVLGAKQNPSSNDNDQTEGGMGRVMAACIMLAATTYEIPPALLLGIYMVREGEVGKEYKIQTNGTFDIGMMRINSSKLGTLSKLWGVDKKQTREWIRDDPCTNSGVAAWLLAGYIEDSGSVRQAIALYNEGTDEQNERFRERLIKELKAYGFVKRSAIKNDLIDEGFHD